MSKDPKEDKEFKAVVKRLLNTLPLPKDEIKKKQRVYTITPSASSTGDLIDDSGPHSAKDVVSKPKRGKSKISEARRLEKKFSKNHPRVVD